MKQLFSKIILVGLALGLIAPLRADNTFKVRALAYTAGLALFGLWAKKQIVLDEKQRRDTNNNLTEKQKELKKQIDQKSNQLQTLNKEIEEQLVLNKEIEEQLVTHQKKNARPSSLWELQLQQLTNSDSQKLTNSDSQINTPSSGQKLAVSRLQNEVETLNQELAQINQQIKDTESHKQQAEISYKDWTQEPLAAKAFMYSLITASVGLLIKSGFTLFNNILDSIGSKGN